MRQRATSWHQSLDKDKVIRLVAHLDTVCVGMGVLATSWRVCRRVCVCVGEVGHPSTEDYK